MNSKGKNPTAILVPFSDTNNLLPTRLRQRTMYAAMKETVPALNKSQMALKTRSGTSESLDLPPPTAGLVRRGHDLHFQDCPRKTVQATRCQ